MSQATQPPKVCVAVVGVGLVGSEFISQLLNFPAPSPFSLVSISSSKKTLFSQSGFPKSFLDTWQSDLSSAGKDLDLPALSSDLAALVGSTGTPKRKVVLVDNTSSDDIAKLYPGWLRAGIEVITPSKKAYSGDLQLYEDIVAASAESGVRFLSTATVGAGLPVISTLKDLVAAGDQIVKIEGVFSGTMSYIFNEFSTGKADGPAFSSVVRVAREKGYTEPHPADDLNGADVARKLTILSRLVPSLRRLLPTGYRSVDTTSLVPADLEGIPTGDEFLQRLPEFDSTFDTMRRDAANDGQVLRFVGVIDVATQQIRAGLDRYPNTHAFATSLGGADNIIMFHTERYGARPLIIQGAGAGATVTAMGVMRDLLHLV